MLIKRSLAALVAIAAPLALAAPAGAVMYDGHAGLGAAYQHNQTDLELLAAPGATIDGTSNTIILMADPGGQFRPASLRGQ